MKSYNTENYSYKIKHFLLPGEVFRGGSFGVIILLAFEARSFVTASIMRDLFNATSSLVGSGIGIPLFFDTMGSESISMKIFKSN